MTREELDRAEELAGKATTMEPQCWCIEYWPGRGHPPDCPVGAKLAAARTLVPQLVAEVRKTKHALASMLPDSWACEKDLPGLGFRDWADVESWAGGER